MTSTPPLSISKKALGLEEEPLDVFNTPIPDAIIITRQQTDQTQHQHQPLQPIEKNNNNMYTNNQTLNDLTPIDDHDSDNNAFTMPTLLTRQKTDDTPHNIQFEANTTHTSINNNHNNNDDEQEIILPAFKLLRQKTDNTPQLQTDDTKDNMDNIVILDMPLQITRQETDQTDKDSGNKSPSVSSPDMSSVNDLLLAPLTRQQTDQTDKDIHKSPSPNLSTTDPLEVVDIDIDFDHEVDEEVLFDFGGMNLERQQTDILVENINDNMTQTETKDTLDMSMKLASIHDISRRVTDMVTNVENEAEDSANMMINQMDEMEVHNEEKIKFLPSRVTVGKKEEVISNINEYLDESLVMFDVEGKLLDMDDENFIGLRKIENENDSENSAQVQSIEDDCFNQFIEHKQPIICMAFAPNKTNKITKKMENQYEIITGGQDETCYIWNIIDYDCSNDIKTELSEEKSHKMNKSKNYFKLNDHGDTIIDCSYNKTGKFIATAAMDNSIKIYNCKKEKKPLISSLDIDAEISFIKWHSHEKNILMAGSFDKNVWIYKYSKVNKKFENTQILCGHSGKIECGGFTKYNGGVYGYSGDEDGMIIIWENIVNNLFFGKKKYSFKPGKNLSTIYHEAGINVMDDCMTSPLLISGSSDYSVCLINYENGKILQKLGKHEDSVECVKFNQLNILNIASSSALDGCVKVWDLNKAKIRNTLRHDDAVIVHQWLNTQNNSNLIVSGCMNGGVYVWDIRSEQIVKEFKGHQKCCIQTIKVSNDDKYIVSGADDSTAMVWKFQ